MRCRGNPEVNTVVRTMPRHKAYPFSVSNMVARVVQTVNFKKLRVVGLQGAASVFFHFTDLSPVSKPAATASITVFMLFTRNGRVSYRMWRSRASRPRWCQNQLLSSPEFRSELSLSSQQSMEARRSFSTSSLPMRATSRVQHRTPFDNPFRPESSDYRKQKTL